MSVSDTHNTIGHLVGLDGTAVVPSESALESFANGSLGNLTPAGGDGSSFTSQPLPRRRGRPLGRSRMENEHFAATGSPDDRSHDVHPENAGGEGDGGRKRPPVRTRPVEARVGEEVRRLRLAAGLTQHDLALGARMSNSYISRLEAGEVNPTVEALHRIARIFGTTIDAIVIASLARRDRQPVDITGQVISSEIDPADMSLEVEEVNDQMVQATESFSSLATSQLLGSDEIDPEVKIWLFRLRGKRISGKAKRIIRTVIEEELKELEELGG